MADGQVPDQTQALLQMQALINSSRGSGKPSFMFGVIPMDTNAGGGLGLAAAAPFAKTIAPLLTGRGKQGGMGDKFLQAWQNAGEDVKKAAQGAMAALYSGDVPSGSTVSSNLGGGASGGGSFVDMVSSARAGGGAEVG